ncbi:ester cyclase [uncultured Shewanella sp.]|uniref:ester cyclase n=1 Tax=uncultured Shewanella sp. TaxID=173975 RepID=UPI002625B325|nr:ester cyclase [uncultured Shewanella sp.]
MPVNTRTCLIPLLLTIFLIINPSFASTHDALDSQQASIEKNKALSRQSLGMWSSHNTIKPENVFVTNYVNHQIPSLDGKVAAENVKQWKELVSVYHDSFSKSNVKILLQVAEKEFVTTYWQITATQSKEYLGVSPTGKSIAWSGVEIDRFENNKIAESWVIWDMYSMFTQLGVIKSPQSLKTLSGKPNKPN